MDQGFLVRETRAIPSSELPAPFLCKSIFHCSLAFHTLSAETPRSPPIPFPPVLPNYGPSQLSLASSARDREFVISNRWIALLALSLPFLSAPLLCPTCDVIFRCKIERKLLFKFLYVFSNSFIDRISVDLSSMPSLPWNLGSPSDLWRGYVLLFGINDEYAFSRSRGLNCLCVRLINYLVTDWSTAT